MFEDKTYENILNEMLARVSGDVDKREGSFVYDALAPAAFELSQAYTELSDFVDLFYLDTSEGDYFDRKLADYGDERKAATYATRKITTDGTVPIGSRWGKNDTTYAVTAAIADNTYSAVCEQSGTIGNAYTGALDNIDGVPNVTAALADVLIAGTDAEGVETARTRVQQNLIEPAQDGNDAQYKKWATDYAGIGNAKVFPLWAGGNTVKVAITNGSFLPAEPALVAEFQTYMDPGTQGLGNGVAPCGSKVTITGGTQKAITVTGNVTLAEGYTEAEGAAEAVAAYLASITYEKNSVSYMKVGNAILDCPSVADLSNVAMNGGTADVALTGEDIPVLTDLNLTVVS